MENEDQTKIAIILTGSTLHQRHLKALNKVINIYSCHLHFQHFAHFYEKLILSRYGFYTQLLRVLYYQTIIFTSMTLIRISSFQNVFMLSKY